MRFLLFLFLTASVLFLVCLARTLRTPARKSVCPPSKDEDRCLLYAGKLSAMVRYATVSIPHEDQRDLFLGYHKVLEDLFPALHAGMEKTEIDGNLLYYWKGASSDRPLVLMGHQDVVPAAGDWDRDPFSGDLEDGRVYGRGSVDTKCSVMAFMQAAEELIREGFVPAGDIYLLSSCTEEWAGDGCPKLIEELKRRGVKPWLVMDEGGGLYPDPMPGIRGCYAMVGICEKGRANVRFTARGEGGHTNTPRKDSPLVRLAAFVRHMSRRQPFMSRILPETRQMLETLAPGGSFPVRLALSNLWLFGPLVAHLAPLVSGQAASFVRTTFNFTMASGSEACNVMPREASVWANLRFIRHQDMAESLAILEREAGRFGLEMETESGNPSTRPADLEGEAYRLVTDTVKRTFPDCVPAPFIITAATDAAFFDGFAETCIRFAPIVYTAREKQGIHGVNESLACDCLPGAVDYFRNLMRAERKG